MLGVPAVATRSTGTASAPTADEPLTVGVTGVSARGGVPEWMQNNTRDGLNTLLSKVPRLRVFSREKIDFLRERRGLSEIEVAETLGIQKMIVGSLAMDGGDVVLEARVVDIATGILDASESTRGDPDGLIELQNALAVELLSALHVPLSDQERSALFARTNQGDARRLTAGSPTRSERPRSVRPRHHPEEDLVAVLAERRLGRRAVGPRARHPRFLEAYRAALEKKDVEAVPRSTSSSQREQRTGFERYFESADDLHVTLSDVDVLVEGDEALATFTRRDVFHDRQSGKPVELEVRLSSVVVQRDGHWLMMGVKRS
jgi:TolB-like protein/ketosteroid isomerase-like protein